MIMPIILVVVLGLLDLGRAVFSYNTLSQAARSGNRVAIVDQDISRVRTRAIQSAATLGLSTSNVDVCFKRADSSADQLRQQHGRLPRGDARNRLYCDRPSAPQLRTDDSDPERLHELHLAFLDQHRADRVRMPRRDQNNMSMKRHDGERGQALVIMAISLTVVLAGAAMVIDGGNAMAQQRHTQNATDAAALAGALVIAEKMSGDSRVDADVVSAMSRSFSDNGYTTMGTSYYVSFGQAVVGTVGRGGSIPSEADGVRATGQRTFDTFLAGIAGQNTWTAGAQATAIAGGLRSACAANDGCGVMPVTFSIPITTCDGSGQPLRLTVDWPLVSLETALADTSGQHMSIVPLCKNGPGGVGWLDFECGANLAEVILHPCHGAFDIPTWLHTESGNVNAVENEMNTYAGTVIVVPMFDATCREVPSTGLPADCTDAGDGDNIWYHIPRFAHFLLDRAYISGSNTDSCNEAPGKPYVGGNGGTSCFKGHFVRYITEGRVGEWEPCDEDTDTDCVEEPSFGIQLVQ